MKSQQAAEREEQQRIKNLVLNYDLGDDDQHDGTEALDQFFNLRNPALVSKKFAKTSSPYRIRPTFRRVPKPNRSQRPCAPSTKTQPEWCWLVCTWRYPPWKTTLHSPGIHSRDQANRSPIGPEGGDMLPSSRLRGILRRSKMTHQLHQKLFQSSILHQSKKTKTTTGDWYSIFVFLFVIRNFVIGPLIQFCNFLSMNERKIFKVSTLSFLCVCNVVESYFYYRISIDESNIQ